MGKDRKKDHKKKAAGPTTEEKQKAGELIVGATRRELTRLSGKIWNAGADSVKFSNSMAAALSFLDDQIAKMWRLCMPGRRSVCSSRCYACCYLRTEVNPLEAIHIANHVRSSWPVAKRFEFILRLRQLVEATNDISQEDWLRNKIACPFLEDGTCSIYRARPMSCRGWNSFDAGVCAEGLAAGDPNYSIPHYGGQKSLAIYAQVGLFYGRDYSPHILPQAVLFALEGDDVQAAYLAGHVRFPGDVTPTDGRFHVG